MNLLLDFTRFPWLTNIPKTGRQEKLYKLLELGYLVSNTVELSINPMNQAFIPLVQKMDDVDKKVSSKLNLVGSKFDSTKEEIDAKLELVNERMNSIHKENSECISDFRKVFNKNMYVSSLKGKIGEGLIERIVEQFFTEDQLANTSGTAKAGDYHLHFVKENITIILEIKIYGHPVDQKEIDKFLRDLIYQKKSGIMISLTSNIVKKKKLQIDEVGDGNIAVYVGNAGDDGSSIIWSILLLKELLLKKKDIVVDCIDTDKIIESISKLQENFKIMSQLVYSIRETRDLIHNKMDQLTYEALSTEIKLKSIIDEIHKNITSELSIIDETIELFEESEQELLLADLDKNKSKILESYRLLFELVNTNNLEIAVNGENWRLSDGTDMLADIKRTKNKIDLKFTNKALPKTTIELSSKSIDLIKMIIKK